MHRKHEIVKREFRRLRKTEPRFGKTLTEAGTRCGGEMTLARISAASLVSFDAAAVAGLR